MPLLRYLQHWLTGRGPRLQVADVVPETHPLRPWADTFPWAAMVGAVDRSFVQRFPKATTRGRPPVSMRVLLALALLTHELAWSDEPIGRRLRTDVAVLYACGSREVQVDGSQDHFVLPEVLPHFRRRLAAPLDEADLHGIRTPTQVHLAYACGDSRPVIERIIASLLCRGAAHLTYQGHRGAIVHTGMAVMAHNAATLVRIHDSRLSKRARWFRRKLRLRCRKLSQGNASIN